PGRQYLTADVNFTDLMHWSEPWTAEPHLQTLAAFLRNAIDPSNPADRALTDEHGAGGAYLVLDQKCKITYPGVIQAGSPGSRRASDEHPGTPHI
ncbi:MAG: hypothetical protein NTV46_13675, partial [Verrucomicrobia bacterium]|nr:hypothetical protein [Verrucomicrobiota bacterium]